MIIGNSGCNIEIKNNILTKTSANILYNDRLIKQMNKQISFNKNMFKTPTVLSNHINTDTDLFSFDMNYINGYDSIDYFNIIGKYEIDLFLDKIYSYFNSFKTNCEFISVNILDEKIYPIILDYKYLIEKYNKIKSDIYIPLDVCHGDFTLSNMIFYNEEIYLIDFLDTFIESPIQDMVKIKQDIEYLYFLKLSNKYNLKSIIVCDYLNNEITNYFKNFNYYNKYYKLFQFINIARILPYCKNKKMHIYLKKILYKL